MLIREAMRRELGFTIRADTFRTLVYLDFYDDAKQTWFMLKYSDYLGN